MGARGSEWHMMKLGSAYETDWPLRKGMADAVCVVCLSVCFLKVNRERKKSEIIPIILNGEGGEKIPPLGRC